MALELLRVNWDPVRAMHTAGCNVLTAMCAAGCNVLQPWLQLSCFRSNTSTAAPWTSPCCLQVLGCRKHMHLIATLKMWVRAGLWLP